MNGLARRVLGRSLPALSGTGGRLERTGYLALSKLEAHGPLRASDLAGLLELDLSTVSRQVRLLEDAGLVSRSADPSDGRAHLLALSPAGRSALDAARRARHAVLERAMDSWTTQERHRLLELLERLAADLDTPVLRTPVLTGSVLTPAEETR